MIFFTDGADDNSLSSIEPYDTHFDDDVLYIIEDEFSSETAKKNFSIPLYREGVHGSMPTIEELETKRKGDRSRTTSASWWVCIGITIILIMIGALAGTIKKRRENTESPFTSMDANQNNKTLSCEDAHGDAKNVNNGRKANFSSVQRFLWENGISSKPDILNPKSFQHQATEYIAYVDEANLPLPSGSMNKKDGYFFVFRYVMILNYFALNGTHWYNRCAFLNKTNVCEWNDGIFHDGEFAKGVNCDGDIPKFLILESNNLQGEIPTENGLLSTLIQFRMSNNEVSGSIPTEICQMSGISQFALHNNQITGSLPECLDSLEDTLLSLELGSNKLSGSILPQFSKLKKLQYLDVSQNNFEGQPGTVWSEMNSLRKLLAASNKFEGSIDAGFLNNMQHLKHIDLSDNRFSLTAGRFPEHFFRMNALEILNVSGNNLKGSLPERDSPHSKIKYLSMHDNKLGGLIPNIFSSFQDLLHLDLSSNEFTGDYPYLGKKVSLQFLSLSQNKNFSKGPVPEEYSSLLGLEYLSLRGTNRIGSMPEFIGNMTKLKHLDMSINEFTGVFPLAYFKLGNIETMLVNGNPYVSGHIAEDSIGPMKELKTLLMDGMNMTGTLEPLCINHSYDIYADCGSYSVAAIKCTCCECCAPDQFGCSPDYSGNRSLTKNSP